MINFLVGTVFGFALAICILYQKYYLAPFMAIALLFYYLGIISKPTIREKK